MVGAYTTSSNLSRAVDAFVPVYSLLVLSLIYSVSRENDPQRSTNQRRKPSEALSVDGNAVAAPNGSAANSSAAASAKACLKPR